MKSQTQDCLAGNRPSIIPIFMIVSDTGRFKTEFIKMSWKGPKVGQGMLDFVEDCCIGVKSH